MSNQPFDPRGQTIVVTGGGGGIGAALCRAFAAAGASTVVVADLNVDGAVAVCGECEKLAAAAAAAAADRSEGQRHRQRVGDGSSSSSSITENDAAERRRAGAAAPFRAIPVRVDASVDEEIRSLIEQTERTAGPIGLFAANAGVMPPRDGVEATGETSLNGEFASRSDWDYVLGVNLMQLVSVGRHLVPRYLGRRGGGHILITASAAAFAPIGSVSYSVSKAAALNFGEWLSVTYGTRGVGVTCACPQRTRSDMTRDVTGDEGRWMGRLLEADEVASCCLDALRKGKIYAFPHEEVSLFVKRKADDPDRWIKGMRRANKMYMDAVKSHPSALSKL